MAILVVVFVICLGLGVPIVASIVLAGFSAIATELPYDMALFTAAQKMVNGVDNFALLALPFFILAGNLMNRGGIARYLLKLADVLVGRMPGAVLSTNVIANMLFGAVSGSAVAAAAAIGSIIRPKVEEENIDRGFAACVNATSAPAGLLIPPSNTLILYSVTAGSGASVVSLFMAGYIPGILMGLAVLAVIMIYGKKYDLKPNEHRYTFSEVNKIVLQAIPALFMIFIVIGGILSGLFTATESGAIAVVYTFILTMLYRDLDIKGYIDVIVDSALTAGMLLMLIAASGIMSWVMAFTGVPDMIADAMLGLTDNKYAILFLMNIILLVVGTFLDMSPAVLIFTPIFLPIALQVGVDIIHFGIILVFNLCIGIITPPVGNCLFVASSIAKVPIEGILSRIMPFYIAIFVVLMLVTYVPAVSLFLPHITGN